MGMEFDADSKDIIQTIKDSVKTETIKVDEGQFLTRPVYLPPTKPLAAALTIASLTGLVDYINAELDAQTRSNPFVVVDSPTEVSLYNDIAELEERRFQPLGVQADTPHLVFDQYISQEQMIVMLQSRFLETPERADLLEQLGNVVADEELTQEDDGVSQTVTLQQGIRRKTSTIKNPVNLRPFRTFTEIDQPESPFIVRVRKTEREGIQVALYEADGGAWRNRARIAIKEYLANEIEVAGVSVIA